MLAFRLDWFLDASALSDIGRGLVERAENPVALIGNVAGQTPSVLVIDQVDAVSEASGRSSRVREFLFQMVDASRHYPHLRLVIACRTYDLDGDSRLKELLKATSTLSIKMLPLDWNSSVKPLLSQVGLERRVFSEQQQRLLSIPINLQIFVTLAAGGHVPEGDLTGARLFDTLLEMRALELSSIVAWSPQSALAVVADWMSEHQVLTAPDFVLAPFARASELLASVGLITKSRGQLQFAHESFFDHVFSAAFVSRGDDVVTLLLSEEQRLFRRTQVRQILSRLRELGLPEYLQSLRIVMVSGDIRYLIKDAVAAWLSSVTAPVRAEVVALNDWSGRGPEYERLFTIVAHGAHWITALIQHGVIDRLIEGGDATSAQAFSAMKAGAADHAAEVAAYLRNWWGFQPTKTSRLLDWFDRLHLTSPVEPLVSLYLELIGAAPDQYLVSVFEHQFQLAGWVHRNQYDAGARVLGAWLTRWMRQFPNEHPFGPDRGGSQRYWIRKLAEGSPGEFIAAVWQPFVEGIERDRLGLESRRLQFATIRLDDEDGWLAMVGDALSSLAAAEPLRAEGLLRELSNQSKPALWLQLRAIAGDGSVLAQLLPSLIDAPDLFELGDHRDGWRSMADASRASLGHLPEIERGRIEDRIRRYRPEVEIARDAASGHDPQQQQRALRWLARSGEVERAILATIGAANLSPVARSRLEELERKFHGRPLPESGVRGGLVRSPIGLEKAERMSDEQWLNAVARYSDDDEHVYLHNSVVGGAAQLAVTLRALTKAQPARFVGLMERFEQESNLAYVRAVLAGLRESEINDDSESLGVRAFRAVQRWDIEQLRREICWLVEAIPEMGRDPTVFELLLNIAQHGDADDDNVTLSNGGRANDVYHLLHANEDFEANGINGDRGVAWLALAEVLWIDATRLQVIEATLLSRIHAPEEITSVRTCMCQAANSIVKHDVVRGLSILRSLAERDLVAVTTARGRHLLRWAIYNQPAEVQQVVEQLTSANSERVRAVGLWLEAMQALTDLLREKSFATTMVEDELRRRVAGFVAAHNVLSGTVGERAESWLRLLFYDDHASVRQEAARVMWDDMLAPDLGRLEFAFAYLHSPTFVEEPDQLMMAIGKRVDSVPQLARAAVTRVLGLRDEWTTSGHYSFAMHDLGKMLVALYRTCEGDAAAEREVLDLFDTYLMADLRDLQTDIREYERL